MMSKIKKLFWFVLSGICDLLSVLAIMALTYYVLFLFISHPKDTLDLLILIVLARLFTWASDWVTEKQEETRRA